MSIFRFKQFAIQQQHSAAKVGTDGVLLGAWAPLDHHPKTVLDIGAGTGLISLMIAQRAEKSEITALEIDEKAYQECGSNFKTSPWAERLHIEHSSLQDFKTSKKFDLIISNPPFYTETYFAKDIIRNRARNAQHLPFETLMHSTSGLLSKTGVFSVIIPFKEEKNLIQLAEKHELFPFRVLHVKGNLNSPFKRSLLAFSKWSQNMDIQTLIIEKERHHYTKEYIELTKDFYLKM